MAIDTLLELLLKRCHQTNGVVGIPPFGEIKRGLRLFKKHEKRNRHLNVDFDNYVENVNSTQNHVENVPGHLENVIWVKKRQI